MNPKNVSIVIPNWNGEALLKKNLEYVLKACEGSEVIVVDDGSTDGSVKLLTESFPGVKVISKANHEGYSGTVNTGVRQAAGDIVVLLNTDIRPRKDFLKALLPHFDDPKMFAVGCMDRSHEGKKVILRGRGIGLWKNGFFMHERGEVDKTDTAWVSGGSGAFRKRIWEELGGLDERFNPFYWEDIDLSYRAVRRGYKIAFEPESIVDHYHEEGKIKSEFSESEVRTIAYRNQFMFVWKNARPLQLFQHFVSLPLHMLRAIMRGDTNFLSGFVQATLRVFT